MFSLKRILIQNIVLIFIMFFAVNGLPLFAQERAESEDYFAMSLDELLKMDVSAATLFDISRRLVPAAMTTISQEDIQVSGARSLNELLDIYVPNLQVMRHNWGPEHVGIRGIIGDVEDKYLLLVNGRVMNNRSASGAQSERDLPMLGDIHHIDVVRGPGSAIYGPGAVSGVISIVTYNGLNFEGLDVTVRQGFVEWFTSPEIRSGHKFGDNSGIFLYYGMDDYPGADQDDSPYVFGRSFATRDEGVFVQAGEPVPFDIPDDHGSYRSRKRHKVHAQYTHGNFDAWVRYSRGGRQKTRDRHFAGIRPDGGAPPGATIGLNDLPTHEMGYQQLTAFAGYTHEFSPELSVDVALSWDMFDYERMRWRTPVGQREDEYHARALARWRPNEAHSAAVGFEYSYEKFGLDSPGYPHSPAFIARLGEPEVWSTDTYSILGEHQMHVNDQWTAFVGARLDKHTYTDWLFSPRAALVFSPSDKDTLKLIGTQSVRRGLDGELRAQYLETGTKGDEEKIQGLELRYERQQSDHWWLAGSAFYQDIEIMAYGGRDRIELLGEYDVWGTELEVSYRTEKTRFALSHAYTKLIDFSLEDPETIQAYSAEPYGYGDDLANWSNHVTKLAVTHDLNDQWSGNASLRVYWGYPGGEDLTHYHNDQVAVRGSSWDHMPLSDPGYDDAFDLSMHLNLGVEYRPTENLTMRLHALNTLGWFDEDLNKRNYIMRVSAYRVEAPAFTLSMTYRF